MDKTSRTIMKISKLRSISLPMNQPTMTTSGALKRAVWIEGPMQWKRAKFYFAVSTQCISELVKKRKKTATYNLSIPRLINCSKMLCCLFNQGKQNQTKELIGNTRLDNVFDALDEEDGEKGDNGQGNGNGDETFRHCELGLGNVFMVVQITVLVSFENFIEDGVLRASIVEDEACTC